MVCSNFINDNYLIANLNYTPHYSIDIKNGEAKISGNFLWS